MAGLSSGHSGHNPTSHSESSSSLVPDVSLASALASALPLHPPPDTPPQSFSLLVSVVRVPKSTPLSLVSLFLSLDVHAFSKHLHNRRHDASHGEFRDFKKQGPTFKKLVGSRQRRETGNGSPAIP